MTISKLATSQHITDKHWGQRDGSQIKYIIPHHMATKWTGEQCAKYFVNNGLENSANYCIGFGGDVSCNVPEEFGAWTSSFSLADKFGITIECSDTASGDWRIPGATQESLIKLMVDLIRRYPSLGGKAVYDPSDEAEVVAAKRAYRTINAKGNILLHVWTSAYGTTCPEWHMKEILPSICAEVNKRLAGGGGTTRTLREEAQYMITNSINGKDRYNQCKEDGFTYEEVQAEIDRMLGKDTASAAMALVAIMPTVKYGDKNDAVAVLQQELKNMGYYNGSIDGQFGTFTQTALKQYQWNINKVYGRLTVDGICGQDTWTRIFLNY